MVAEMEWDILVAMVIGNRKYRGGGVSIEVV